MYYFALFLDLIVWLYTIYVIYKYYIKKENFFGQEYFVQAFAWLPIKDKVASALIISNSITFLFLLGAPAPWPNPDEINQYIKQSSQVIQELNNINSYSNQ